MTHQQTIKKINKMEKELLKLKLQAGLASSQKPISLKGILTGVTFTEKDIKQAKKSLFRC